MKKLLIGCLLFVLLGVGASAAAYYFFVRPAVGEYIDGFLQFSEIKELNEDVENQASFTPPTDDVLTQEQVAHFMAVHDYMRKELGIRMEDLKAKYDTINERIHAQDRDANVSEIMAALKDVSGLLVEAKRIQVEGLNREDFSLAEYEWVRDEVYHAAGMPRPTSGIGGLMDAVREGKTDPQAFASDWSDTEDVPERNRELVAPHVDELKETAGLAWFGL